MEIRPTPSKKMLTILASHPIAFALKSNYSHERPAFTLALLLFLRDVDRDISLLSSSATLLSQVLGSASSTAIWRSVFEIVDPPVSSRSRRALPALPEANPKIAFEATRETVPESASETVLDEVSIIL